MFSSALKSLSSNINSNYSISSAPTTASGPWKIYDAKNKSTGRPVSVFILDRKSIDGHVGSLGRSNASNLKKAIDEIIERLKKEASSLARLRHPNILELVEPVEDTRNGGLQFATETVTASLSRLLQNEKNRNNPSTAETKSSRHNTDDSERCQSGTLLELDELEIRKGLEQISKALGFLHDNAGLLHGNLTPDSVFLNAKSDWKISGLSFSSPPVGSTKASSVAPIILSEVLDMDPRLPRSVQINLDYCSPDLVLDSNLNFAADLFSFGLLIIALYDMPHTSPLKVNSSISTYKRLFESPSTTPSSSNGFLASRPLPKDLVTLVLPRLLTRHPENRMTAKEFLKSPYFDNILISTIGFLDSLPAKSPNEKVKFMKGLLTMIPSFPSSILEKKILPALLETKDPELLSLILQNVFCIMRQLGSGRKSLTEKIIPKLNKIFISTGNSKALPERDPTKEAGLMVLLGQIHEISQNCSANSFKDCKLTPHTRDPLTIKVIFPIVILGIESPTYCIVDASLQSIHVILPVLDFSTLRNELFPIVASVFSKTSNLRIKVRGLEAISILCGGSTDPGNSSDGLDGIATLSVGKQSSPTALDKYAMQEKILPLIRAIKTKEPAVAMAALNVLRQVGRVADPEFIAMDIMPVLWRMSLGPLMNLEQFHSFMEVIKLLSTRVEITQTKKLQELPGPNERKTMIGDNFMSPINSTLPINDGSSQVTEASFQRLVKGSTGISDSINPMDSDFDTASGYNRRKSLNSAWSGSNLTTAIPGVSENKSNPTIPSQDLSRFSTLNPISTQYSIPLQPQNFSSKSLQLQSTGTIASSTSSSMDTSSFSLMHPSTNLSAGMVSNSWASSNSSADKIPSANPPPLASMNNYFSHLSPSEDPRTKYGPSLLQMARNSAQPEARNYNSFLLPPSSSSNDFNITPLPQSQYQINESATSMSPMSQQRGDVESLSIPPPNLFMQSQKPSKKNGWEVWESLL